MALDALADGHRDLAPGGYTVACPPWSLGEGPFQLEPVAVRGLFPQAGWERPRPSSPKLGHLQGRRAVASVTSETRGICVCVKPPSAPGPQEKAPCASHSVTLPQRVCVCLSPLVPKGLVSLEAQAQSKACVFSFQYGLQLGGLRVAARPFMPMRWGPPVSEKGHTSV